MGSTDGDSRRNAGNLRETGEHTLVGFKFRVRDKEGNKTSSPRTGLGGKAEQ